MNQKELKELIDFLIEKDISEFELERGDVKVRIKRGADASVPMMVQAAPVPAQMMAAPPMQAMNTPTAGVPAPAAPAAGAPAAAEEELHSVKSPIVGTFYESPAPGAPPFVKPGDQVAAGQVLCIIEAMKLMNEIESDVSGEVVKMLVNNSQPVEYGQPLFAIRPRK
ncbi:MAG TPA: acetyl-CoA carboxylase biotin carboxyl carrier protein [Candidatus Angelobacter sp.]|nr:acetyl-CoA carboxylase biotin carboxyl carrier protein [Candidatus Angelobacter sp.]